MVRTLRLAVVIAILSAGVAALGHEFFYLHWLRSVLAQAHEEAAHSAPIALDR